MTRGEGRGRIVGGGGLLQAGAAPIVGGTPAQAETTGQAACAVAVQAEGTMQDGQPVMPTRQDGCRGQRRGGANGGNHADTHHIVCRARRECGNREIHTRPRTRVPFAKASALLQLAQQPGAPTAQSGETAHLRGGAGYSGRESLARRAAAWLTL